MKSIVDLWNEHLLPIKDAIYFADGSAFSVEITSYPTPSFEKGDDFCFSDFFKNNSDEITDVDLFKKNLFLIKVGYVLAKEAMDQKVLLHT